MKELTIEQKAKNYDEAIERANELKYVSDKGSLQRKTVERIFPELKESEDERIREELVEHFKWNSQQVLNEFANKEVLTWLEKKRDNISIDFVLGYLGIKPAYKDGNAWCILLGDNIQEGICGFGDTKEEALIAFIKELIEKQDKKKPTNSKEDDVRRVSTIQVLEYAKSLPDYNQFGKDAICKNIAWLEKQSTPTKLSEEEQNKFAKGVLTSCAMSFIDYLDAHKYEGKMCVSNGECEDIENAFQNGMWDKLHRYYCKYIEKQSNNPQGKSALEAVMEEKIDNRNCVKPVDRVEPKFKVGDWVVVVTSEGEKVVQISSIEYFKSGEPRYITSAGKWFGNGTEAHLWTIQDAKAGDALAADGYIIMFKKLLPQNGGVSYCHYDYACSDPYFNFNEDDNWYFGKESKIRPATKEQHDTLLKAMADAGYTFDFEKKELNKIEHKPVWSEDDKKMIDAAIQVAHEYGRHGLWCWLKSLKDRV